MDEKTMNQENDQQEQVDNDSIKEQEGKETNEEDYNQNSELNEQLEKLESEKQELQDKLLRTQADFDNFRRRTQMEKESDLKYKSQELVTEILPALDNFERALQTEVHGEGAQGFVDGVKMVYDQLHQALEKAGVEEIQAENEQFDPNVHQAVMQVQEEGYDSNQIVNVLQKGYKLKDRVIRPAMVQVNE
ncbi:nucleotide exchange factor GrpE [Tenuibacillus multivorans]|uniref:Protein GrpE n=1 Tax=Tenuibacillus multivorans TaxID=237069 RepID=A0A1G9ZGQ5_9BACI|nr:nucleotide exchange factor GrpE [Tenuibacillus multivorans]GEL78330.1 protein GrpE [Tenuibacillus multivorans]SDN19653.1 molecular chaperone GrpE [Tenuibacillus multivorans]